MDVESVVVFNVRFHIIFDTIFFNMRLYFVEKKGSVAFSLSTLRNMMCCVRFQGT